MKGEDLKICRGCKKIAIHMIRRDESGKFFTDVPHVVFDKYHQLSLTDDYTQWVLGYINLTEGRTVTWRVRDLLLEWCWRNVKRENAPGWNIFRECADALHSESRVEGYARLLLMIQCQKMILTQQAKDREPGSKGYKTFVQKYLVTCMNLIFVRSENQCSIDWAIKRLPDFLLDKLTMAQYDVTSSEALKKLYIRADTKHNCKLSQSMHSDLKKRNKNGLSGKEIALGWKELNATLSENKRII